MSANALVLCSMVGLTKVHVVSSMLVTDAALRAAILDAVEVGIEGRLTASVAESLAEYMLFVKPAKTRLVPACRGPQVAELLEP